MQSRRHEESATSLGRALLGRALTLSGSSGCPGDARTTANRWNVPGKYGPYGQLFFFFFFLIMKEPTIHEEVVDFERVTSSDAEDGRSFSDEGR